MAEEHAADEDDPSTHGGLSGRRKVWDGGPDEASRGFGSFEYTEGQARRGVKEFGQFLSLAQGSLAELETQVLLSVPLGYSGSSDVAPITTEITEIQRMVGAIQKKLSMAVASD